MPANEILNLLKDADLLRQQKRLSKLKALSPSDYSLLLNKLEKGTRETTNIPSEIAESMNLWLPFVTEGVLNDIPSYLFLFDKVYLLDPLFDYFSWLELDDEQTAQFALSSLANTIPGKDWEHAYKIYKETSFEKRFRLVILNKVNNVIEKYAQLQDLIVQDGLDFYYDFGVAQEHYAEAMAYFQYSYVNNELDEVIDKDPQRLRTVAKSQLSGQLSESIAVDDLLKYYMNDPMLDILQESMRSFYTSYNFKSIFPAKSCENIDFGRDKNKSCLDKIIEYGSSFIDKELFLHGIQWPQPEHALLFPSLHGIPSQELIAIREKEKPAFDKFRYGMQQKLIELRSALGSKDYQKLVLTYQVEQKKEIAEYKLLAEHVKKKYFRRTANNIGIAAASAATAILSASVAIKDPITLLGVGIGSAGVTAGLSKLIETWMDYTSEIDKLKEKDSYILWKISSSQKK